MAKKPQLTSIYVPNATALKWNAGDDHEGVIRFIDIPDDYLTENIELDGFDSLDAVKDRLFLDTLLQKLKSKHGWTHETTPETMAKELKDTKIRFAVKEFPVISISAWIKDNLKKLPFLKDLPPENVRDMIRVAYPSHILVD